MTVNEDLLERLRSADEMERRAAVDRCLQRVAHDLRGPLASFRLELFSLRELCQELSGLVAAGATDGVPPLLAEVADIVENLEGSLETATDLADEVSRVGQAVAPERGETP